ncbi:MAG: GerMN domain-containing protein [Acidimicrobiales bacterium]
MRTLRALGVAVAALSLAGCGLITPAAGPTSTPPSRVGFSLLSPTIPGTNHARVRFETEPIFIVDAAGHLSPTSRIVPSPPSIATVVGQLLAGPTAIERSAGFTSALPSDLVLIAATVRRHIGYVDLSGSLTHLPRPQELLAIGQLVLTAAYVGATQGLQISLAGAIQSLPLPSGGHASVLTVAEYAGLLNG